MFIYNDRNHNQVCQTSPSQTPITAWNTLFLFNKEPEHNCKLKYEINKTTTAIQKQFELFQNSKIAANWSRKTKQLI